MATPLGPAALINGHEPAPRQQIVLTPEKMIAVRALAHPRTEIVPSEPFVRRIRKAQGKRPATMEVEIPKELALNLRGPEPERDVLFFMLVPRAVFDALSKPAPPPSRIVGPDGNPA